MYIYIYIFVVVGFFLGGFICQTINSIWTGILDYSWRLNNTDLNCPSSRTCEHFSISTYYTIQTTTIGEESTGSSFQDFYNKSFSHSSVGKESTCNADQGSIPGSRRFHGEGNGNPLQYSCLENPMDRGACQATVHGVTRVRHDLVTKPPPPPYNPSLAGPLNAETQIPRAYCKIILEFSTTQRVSTSNLWVVQGSTIFVHCQIPWHLMYYIDAQIFFLRNACEE